MVMQDPTSPDASAPEAQQLIASATFTNPHEPDYQYHTSLFAVWVQEVSGERREFVIHQCNGSTVINPVDALPDASQFDAYMDDAIASMDLKVIGMANWDPEAKRYHLFHGRLGNTD